MNRTDRLLAIVLELQRRGRLRAEDLAATFETSKRTIYRDIQALCEAGVPVVASPGQGYSLVEGFFLPPVQFTTDEATVLLLGSDLLSSYFDATYREAARSAVRKVEAVLPEPLLAEVKRLRERLLFVPPESATGAEVGERVRALRRAIIEQRGVRFTYFARHRSDGDTVEPPREADPYGLVFAFGAWHLHAYCQRRQARRNFRLDRMEGLELLERRFAPPVDTLFLRPSAADRPVEVRVLFQQGVARWAREQRFFFVEERERPDGLEVVLRVHREEEIVSWVLGWGSRVRVLAPESLRELVAAEAAAVAHMYQTADSLLT